MYRVTYKRVSERERLRRERENVPGVSVCDYVTFKAFKKKDSFSVSLKR